MKKYKNGMILGKFYPPTKGHFYLIEHALERCDRLTILVCSLPTEKIPGTLRHTWIKKQFPKANVIHIDKELQQYPIDDHDIKFWDIWTEVIAENVKDMDVVFTSELYGDKIASELNDRHIYTVKIEHELVDLYRNTVPISGSLIRSNPYKYWDYIPEIERSYFTTKIALLGPESVGKSVMTKQLAQHYNTNYVLEYGRYYYEKLVKQNKKFDTEDAYNIMEGHRKWEDEAIQKSNKLLFCDTEALTTKIWLKVISNQTDEFLEKYVENFKYGLYLLLTPEVEWINDGTRAYSGEIREKQFFMIKEELEKRELNYRIISGKDYTMRKQQAIVEIDSYINTIHI